MKLKKTLLLLPLLLIASCDKRISTSNGLITTPTISTPSTSSTVNNTSPVIVPPTTNGNEASTTATITTTSTPSTTTSPITTPVTPSTNKPSTSTIANNRPATNPDGSKTLDLPDTTYGVDDISEWVNYDFSSPDTFPSSFRGIYGNNFNYPDFYAESAGGGLKINKNETARKGFQTGYFTPFVKLEVRIKIGAMNNNSKPVNDKDPALTIYGFDSNGLIVATEIIENFDKSKENSYVRLYLRNINITYLEVRATNLPYKGSQVYNYAIKGLDLKGWIYE